MKTFFIICVIAVIFIVICLLKCYILSVVYSKKNKIVKENKKEFFVRLQFFNYDENAWYATYYDDGVEYSGLVKLPNIEENKGRKVKIIKTKFLPSAFWEFELCQ